MEAPAFRIADVELYERDVSLRMPFRFGSATLTACPQAFVRARDRASPTAAAPMAPLRS